MTMSKRNQQPSLAALRHFFDTLVTRHTAPLNSFQSVRAAHRLWSMRRP